MQREHEQQVPALEAVDARCAQRVPADVGEHEGDDDRDRGERERDAPHRAAAGERRGVDRRRSRAHRARSSTAITPGTRQKLVCATTSWAMLTPWSVIMRPTARTNANGWLRRYVDLRARLHVVVRVVPLAAERRREKVRREVVVVGPVRPRRARARRRPPSAPMIAAPIERRWRHAGQQQQRGREEVRLLRERERQRREHGLDQQRLRDVADRARHERERVGHDDERERGRDRVGRHRRRLEQRDRREREDREHPRARRQAPDRERDERDERGEVGQARQQDEDERRRAEHPADADADRTRHVRHRWVHGRGGEVDELGRPDGRGIAQVRPHLARVVRVELARDQQLLEPVLEPARNVRAEIGRGITGPVP